MDLYKKALEKIEKDKRCEPQCSIILQVGPTGPTGPIGPQGPVTVTIGKTETGLPGEVATVQNMGTDENIILDFLIPQGPTGSTGPTGPQGNQGEPGPMGPQGTIGATGPIGPQGIQGLDGIQGEEGPTGPTGPTGPAGPELISAAYFVTFNQIDYPPDGLEVQPNTRLPINLKEMDTNNIATLNNNDNTISFNKAGFYKITLIVNAYTKSNSQFSPDNDFVSVGFREINTDNTYIGGSIMIPFQTPFQLTAQGIITVVSTNLNYELANLSKNSIYLSSPQLPNINSTSYFSNSLITIITEYLGRPIDQ